MHKIGTTLKQIREEKSLSLDQLSENILSKSQLSKFERNLSDISAIKLIMLLKKLNVELSEFSLLINDKEKDDEYNMLVDITQAILTMNKKKADYLVEKAKLYDSSTKSNSSKLNYIMIYSLSLQLTKDKLPIEYCDFLIDFLFKIENWTKYELILYGNTMHSLPIDSVNLLSKELTSRTLLYSSINDSIIVNLLFNTVIINLENNQQKQAAFFISALDNFTLLDIQLGERFLREFASNLYSFCHEDKFTSKQKILDLLSVLQLLKSDDLYIFLTELFESFL